MASKIQVHEDTVCALRYQAHIQCEGNGTNYEECNTQECPSSECNTKNAPQLMSLLLRSYLLPSSGAHNETGKGDGGRSAKRLRI